MTPTLPPQPLQESADVPPTPSLAKKIKTENVGDQPFIVMVEVLIHGPAPSAQSSFSICHNCRHAFVF